MPEQRYVDARIKAVRKADHMMNRRIPFSPWKQGLIWAVFSIAVIVVYEAFAFSSFEFQPNTIAVTLVAIFAAFGAGYLDQRQAYGEYRREIERLMEDHSREESESAF